MEKKYLFPLIIFLAFVIDIITGRVLYNVYLNSGVMSSDAGFASYTITTMALSLVFSVPFYVLILWKFPEHKLLSYYAAMSLIVAFCFAGYVSLANYFDWNTIIIKLYAGISYIIGFINIILATTIILKELHTKVVSISILYLAITQFVFGTLVVDYIRGYLVGFFGPYEENLAIVFVVYDSFLIFIQLTVVIVQILAIRSLLLVQEGHVRVYRRM